MDIKFDNNFLFKTTPLFDLGKLSQSIIAKYEDWKNERKINRIETYIKDLNKNKYCTLKETVKKYGRQKDGKIKWLKLVELFKILFNKKFGSSLFGNLESLTFPSNLLCDLSTS